MLGIKYKIFIQGKECVGKNEETKYKIPEVTFYLFMVRVDTSG